MCGITGWVDWMKDLTHFPTIVEAMTETLTPRGPDANGTWLSPHCALGHRRLSVMDPENGMQPMSRKMGARTYTVVYNGEIYNARELRNELKCRGHRFHTKCDTEVLLLAYMEWGPPCVEKLNGIFAFAVWNDVDESLFMARDRLGVKPLFYSCRTGTLLFGSEPKAILAHPGFHAEADGDSLAEIFAIGPARTPGHGIFKHMQELRPGYCLHFSRGGLRTYAYWQLESREHADDLDKTVTAVRELLLDTVHRQLISDVPVCTLLSGGLDSSALTAIASAHYRDSGLGKVDTYSVDYADNEKHFKSSAFTPNNDAPWIKRMSEHASTRHTYVEFDTPELVDALTEVVLARDSPGMADVDASLLLFSREIKQNATVALSGEAADEIFGGYPWFHRNESLEADTFPWSLKLKDRLSVLSPELIDFVNPGAYVQARYEEALSEVPALSGEAEHMRRMREMSYLNITRFMPTLLDRKDRMSMRVGLEVRVPYCDHRLVEYVFNIPWAMKTAGNREKGILRQALAGILPEDVLYRKKSPYPKTHNPNYMKAVKAWMLDILDDPASPILPFVNVPKLRELAASANDSFDIPWFGQLMTGPQLFAYLAQVNFWLQEYRISVK